MTKALYKGRKGRKIQVLSLFDENKYGINDKGLNKEGDETQSRACARATLTKTRVVDGKDFRCFALAETPEVLHPNDPFDRQVLKDQTGNWVLPSAEWLAARDLFIARRRSAAADAKQIVANKATQNLIANLMTLSQNDPSIAPAVKKALDEAPAVKKGKADA
jgi:hypothetical protein